MIDAPSWQAVKSRACEGAMGDTIVWSMDGSSEFSVKVVGSPASSGVKVVLKALRVANFTDEDDDQTLLSFSMTPPTTLRAIIQRAGEMSVGEGV